MSQLYIPDNVEIWTLSGAQTSGKSTIQKALRGLGEALPGIHIVMEAAKTLIDKFGKLSVQKPYFQEPVFRLQQERLIAALAECNTPGPHLILVERGALDNWVYIALNMHYNPAYQAEFEAMYPPELRAAWLELMLKPQHHLHFLCEPDFKLVPGVNIAWDHIEGEEAEMTADDRFAIEVAVREKAAELFVDHFERHQLPHLALEGKPEDRIQVIDTIIQQRLGIEITREGDLIHVTREGTMTTVQRYVEEDPVRVTAEGEQSVTSVEVE